MSVLLAEDNKVNQLLTARLLNKLGFHVDIVTNGQDAVTALKNKPYDLVIMDGHMPGMNGDQAARYIRDPTADGLPHDIPIIAYTADASPAGREFYLAAGVNEVMIKPLNAERLKKALLAIPAISNKMNSPEL